MKSRVVIEEVVPQVNCGLFAVKRVEGEILEVFADIYIDGHDKLDADLLIREESQVRWMAIPMTQEGNDRWRGLYELKSVGRYLFTIQAWINPFQSWKCDFLKKVASNQDVSVDRKVGEILMGGRFEDLNLDLFLERIESSDLQQEMREQGIGVTRYEKELVLECLPKKALFSSWYECFPRSFGTFREFVKIFPRIADLGFDVLYLPPIHPIGKVNRKGKNNQTLSNEQDPGSPWAIASHMTVDPGLGSLSDFHFLLEEAKKWNLEVALDLAFQCAPDHPYVKSNPSWFKWRPDRTVQYAENPPKKYEDVLPFNFDTLNWQALWEECKQIAFFWMDQGVTLFRVDNPHTKPFEFWRWLIREAKQKNQNVVFLSEAFTREKVMKRLAKVGFDQSYTYFCWKNTKEELISYIQDLTNTNMRNYFIPNFWPNTPDILPEFLQVGTKEAFIIRLILAATLSSNYGIYGPAFEHLVSEAVFQKEEYLHSEKYEYKDWSSSKSYLDKEIKLINSIRRENSALMSPWNVLFCKTENNNLLAYCRYSNDFKNVLLIVVCLNPQKEESGYVCLKNVPLIFPFFVENLLTHEKCIWTDDWQELTVQTASIFRLQSMREKEKDFDYYG